MASPKSVALMPNSNYARGRAREYQVINTLRSQGWVCSRSAMSHGPVDIFAARSGKVLLIQVKSGSARIKRDELELLRSFAQAFNAEAQVWTFIKRGLLSKVTVNRTKRSRAVKPHAATEVISKTGPSIVPLENPPSLTS